MEFSAENVMQGVGMVAKAAASIVKICAGKSLKGKTIEQISNGINTGRNVCIEISNCSEKYHLTKPSVYTYSGYCLHPPHPTIAVKTKEFCSFNKVSDTACGAVGVLTYQIHKKPKHRVADLAIMFSVPFDYNLYENWFALGIYDSGVSCDHDLYNQMYYNSGPFTRSKGTGSVIEHGGKDVLVKGTMSAAGKSIMRVELCDV